MDQKRNHVRTKIVCTVGPSSRDPNVLRDLLREGMTVVRVNYSHGERDEHANVMTNIRDAENDIGEPVAILADLQGPKIRLGILTAPVDVRAGQRFALADVANAEDKEALPFPYPDVVRSLQPGARLLFDDGTMEAVVREVRQSSAQIEFVSGGRLSSHKGVALPGTTLALPVLSDKDREDAAHAVAHGADFIGLSFVQSGEDVKTLRAFLDSLPNGRGVGIIAKIETRAAIDHLDEVLHVSDAVMVARGDLGVEISPQEVPMHQKDIIRRANRLGVPAITATQMLQSMVENLRPTRAEASDVANAILDGTDAVMLSAETAIGAHPREAVTMMREIAAIAETKMPCRANEDPFGDLEHAQPITDAIGDATVRVAEEVGARLIATSTWSGYTARQISRERPRLPILALTPNESVRRRLALTWGVESIRIPAYRGTDDMLELVSQALLGSGSVREGDLVVVCAGIPSGGGGKTNFLKVHRI